VLNIIDNNYKKKSNINFGTNLIVGQGVTDQLNKHPEDLKKIQDFKEYLANDGKNWNAELTYDTFAPKQKTSEETEKFIKKSANIFDIDSMHSASESISNMEPQEAVALIKKLASGDDERVQNEAVGQSGKIKDSRVAVSLIEEFSKSQNPRIKDSAVSSLNDIKDDSIKKQALEKFMNSDDIAVRRRAVRIALVDESNEFNSLLEPLSKDSDLQIRENVLSKIHNLKDEEYTKNAQVYDSIIENASKDEDLKGSYSVLDVIGKMSDSQKSVNFITDYIENSDKRWRKGEAARSLVDVKDKQLAKETIEKLLNHPDFEVQEGASSAAVEFKDAKTQMYFIDKLLDNKNPRIRSNISYGYGTIDNPKKLTEVAEKLLADSDPQVRENTARHFGCIKDAKTRDALIEKHIGDSSFEIKSGILDAIGDIGNVDHEKAMKYAQTLSKDQDKYIKKEADKVIERLNSDSERDHYTLKISDGDKLVEQKQVMETRYGEKNILKSFFNAYKAIFEKNAQ